MFTATHDRACHLSSDRSSRDPALSRDAIAAAALTVAYGALVPLAISGPLWLTIAEWARPDASPARVLVWSVATVLIAWMVLPRRDQFEPTGAPVSTSDEPALLAALEGVAAGSGQTLPAEIYLVNDVAASVTWRGGIAGFGSRPVLLLGLPLLETLSVQELTAVVAQAFARQEDGVVRLGRWIRRTRTAILVTMAGRPYAAASVFAWYGALFLRLTRRVSRQQELAADETAARLAGAAALVAALRRTHAVAVAYQHYRQQEVEPLLERGCLPPLGEGFRRFMSSPGATGYLTAVVQCEAVFQAADRSETNPTLQERIERLERLPAGPVADTRPASSLLTDVIRWEHAVCGAAAAGRELQPIAWDHVAEALYLPLWRARVDSYGHLLRGLALGTLPTTSAEFLALGSRMSPSSRAAAPSTDRACLDRAGHLVLAAIAVRLADLGWSVSALPGEETVLRRGGHELRPYGELRAVLDGRVPSSHWHERCTALGIADVPLWGIPDSACRSAGP